MSPPRRSIPIAPAQGLATTRRGALQWMAAAMALATSACGKPPDRPIYSYARSPEREVEGEPLHYATAVLKDGFAQGVLVGTQQGRPIKAEGQPLHPASLGRTSVFAQAEVLNLWDPDRSQTVHGPGAALSTWSAFEQAWQGRPVGRLRVLSGPVTSPTMHAGLAALLARHPGARWHRVEPEPASRAGARMAFGRTLQPVWHLDRAALIVSFADDPFTQGPAAVRQAADWASARAEALAADRTPARLVALETSPGLFGARADERWAMSSSAIERVIRQLMDGEPGDATVTRLRALLQAHQGRLALCAGTGLSPEAHARVFALNQRFGAMGRTLDLIAPADENELTQAPVADLVADMRAGRVDTLLVLDANPAYTLASRLGFEAALAAVTFSVHLGLHRDETARRCTWHLPMSHVFEQWGDARAFDGTLTPLQPAIAPLYDTRSAIELLATLAGASAAEGHALVRDHWRGRFLADGSAFETAWRQALRVGQVDGSAAPVVAVPAARVVSQRSSVEPSPGLQVSFPRDLSVDDGRYANNAWLQELPRPMTQLTWGNALHLGPRTAAGLGVATGDVVRLTGDAGAIEAPVWVQAGHAEGAGTLPRGYGRRAAGGVGDGVGVDAAPVRGVADEAVLLQAERTGQRIDFAVTQVEVDDHDHDHDLAREVEAHGHVDAARPLPSLYPKGVPPGGLAAWGMAIDLDACIGCKVCTLACQAENNIPVVGPEQVAKGRAMHWIRVDVDLDADGRAMSQPVPCMHCENAPCEVVCPVGATVHDSEGLNVQVYNRCIGTRFCSNNCPYKVRRFNFLQFADVEGEQFKAMRNPDVTVRSRGVMEKCSYCVQRLSRARRDSQKTGRPLRDGDVVTACQGACPTQAIHFGDLNDPASDVARAKASPRHYAMLEELGTRPRTTYLARVKPA